MKFPYKVNICYIINEKGEVLLQKKRRGFGEGNWNGPGGKIEPGETPEEATIREIKEETDLTVRNLEKMAELEFIFPDESSNNYCHVFISTDFEGDPKDMGEGELQWFKKEDVPLDKMWDDDKYWLMDVLNGKHINKRFYFNNQGRVIKHINL
jgi:8-oxo-dGTP diphosphatase